MSTSVVAMAAGAATPVLFAIVARLCAGSPEMWAPEISATLLLSAFFLLLGTSLLPGIKPGPYLLAAVFSVPAELILYSLPDIVGDRTSHNLIGLVGMFGFAAVAILSTIAFAVSRIWRRKHTGVLTAVLVLSLCPVIALLTGVGNTRMAGDSAGAAVVRMKQIHAAELQFAAENSEHTFTCNGPSLPVVGSLSWRPDPLVGGTAKSLALDHNYWFKLRCMGGAQFEITAFPAWGNGRAGQRYSMRQDGQITTVEVP